MTIKESDDILEIGTGTGYFTALLAHCGHHVDSIDIFPDFIERADIKLHQLGINNISLYAGDASHVKSSGIPLDISYDVIVITASMPLLPQAIMEQLKVGGRLFLVLGTGPAMSACMFTRKQIHEWVRHNLFETVVPPLINAPQPDAFRF